MLHPPSLADFDLRAMGDQAILIRLREPLRKTQAVRHQRMLISRLLAAHLQVIVPEGGGWPREFVIGYDSVLAPYDVTRLRFNELYNWLKIEIEIILEGWQTTGLYEPPPQRMHRIPVVYNGSDLRLLAQRNGVSPAHIIELHSNTVYTVYLLGFAPGFAYLGPVPPQIDAPRLAVPRPQVAAGSVGLAAGLTGVYPYQMPGGWNIIGSTTLPMFETNKEPPVRLLPGDTVQFYPV